ncbi:MAG TPA: retroviral-like aspartic protease family protein [Alphaproteobacteria bacterium]|nr:retroviral-like aspartic protease family protein [Alphaproteobacteria bacterium]
MRTCQFMAIAFAALLCSLSNPSAAGEQKTCGLQRVAALDADISRGALLIKIKIEGRETWVRVDTGSPIGMIDKAFAQELKLPLRSAREGAFYDAAGKSARNFVVVHNLNLNGMVAEDVTFLVGGGSGGASDVGGVFGADFLSAYDVELDLAHGKLNLFTQDHCPGNVVYWTQDYDVVPFKIDGSLHATFMADLDGQTMRALLDTGATSTVLTSQVARHRFNFDPEAAGIKPDGSMYSGGGTELPFYLHRFGSLTIGGVQIRNPELKIIADKTTRIIRDNTPKDPIQLGMTEETPLILGLNYLSKLRVYIAYGEHKVYFSAANAQ